MEKMFNKVIIFCFLATNFCSPTSVKVIENVEASISIESTEVNVSVTEETLRKETMNNSEAILTSAATEEQVNGNNDTFEAILTSTATEEQVNDNIDTTTEAALSYSTSTTNNETTAKGFRSATTEGNMATSTTDGDTPEEDLGTWKPMASKSECGATIGNKHFREIFGGHEAQMEQHQQSQLETHQYVALLGYFSEDDKKIYYFCGGSLINKWYVLTAAHCCIQFVPSEVVLGEDQIGKDPDCTLPTNFCNPTVQRRGVEKIIVHELYNPDKPEYPFDIALLRLDQPVDLALDNKHQSAVLPACLPWNTEDPRGQVDAGQSFSVFGWGKTTNDSRIVLQNILKFQAYTDRLMHVKLPLVDIKDCLKDFAQVNSTYHICAGGEHGKDSCQADSGGPLTYQKELHSSHFQVGIVSYGSEPCGVGKPGVYTKIEPFLHWIETNLVP